MAESGRAAETKSQVAATAERATVEEMSVRGCMGLPPESSCSSDEGKLLRARSILGRKTTDSVSGDLAVRGAGGVGEFTTQGSAAARSMGGADDQPAHRTPSSATV